MSRGFPIQKRIKLLGEIVGNLRFKNVSAAMKRMLKRREYPRSAPMQIQYQYSSTNNPLSLRRVFPTVGWLEPFMGCDKRK